MVVQALTKHVGGHSDLMMGSATAGPELYAKLRRRAQSLGQVVSPDDAALALRGLRTLDVRLERETASALAIAQWLAARPEVARVLCPMLPGAPGHDLWRRDFTGGCGLLTFVFRGGDQAARDRFADALGLFGIGYSWGGYESLVTPADPAPHRSVMEWPQPGMAADDRFALRLAIGLEAVGDLIADLERGFAAWGDARGMTSELGQLVRLLDSYGFDIGNTRVSIYRAILVAVVALAVFIVAQVGSVGTRALFRRITRLDPSQQLLGEKLVGVGVWVLAVLVGIDLLGIDLTTLAVFSGAFGLAIGFGLQKTFGNLIAGIILLMDRSIKPGDVIAVTGTGGGSSTGTVGQVNRIGIRAVSVITRDKVEFLIPNENLMINQVENWSYSSRDVRVKVPVGVAYGTDIELAEKLMLQAVKATPRILDVPAPSVWLHSLGDNGILFEIQVWIDDPEEGIGNVRSDVLKRILPLFKEHQIELPYPKRDLRIRAWPDRPDE